MQILVPTTVTEALPEIAGVDYDYYDPAAPLPSHYLGAQCLVVWGNTREQLVDARERVTGLEWVCALSAGTDLIDSVGFAPSVKVTNASGHHDAPVAEHTLMLILAAVRRLDRFYAAQVEGRWASELGGVQPPGPQRDPSTGFPGLATLRGARVTIWGFGSIAQTLAPLLTALGAGVTGVANSAGERAGYPVVGISDVLDVLVSTDILVNILPSLPETQGIMGETVFDALPSHAWVVNVGRGATVDEDALDSALRAGTIGGAALDVFAEEPLPASSPLWTAPNVILTPHAAGGRPIEVDRLIGENVRRFLAGEPLNNRVN